MIEVDFKLQCDKAMNGQDALDKIIAYEKYNDENPCTCPRRRENYRLIFMDCNMPIMDGFEASKKIRDIQEIDQRSLYIVALTAYTDDSFKS